MATITSNKISIPAAPVFKISDVIVYLPLLTATETERLTIITYWLSSFRKPCISSEIALSKLMSILLLSIPELTDYLVTNRAGVAVQRIDTNNMISSLSRKEHPAGLDADDWAITSIEDDCVLVQDKMAIYSAAAVAFMTYAKQAGEGARRAYESGRPGSLIGKYKISDDDLGLFPGGDYGPDVEVLDQINSGFSIRPFTRYMVTAFFISIKRARGQTPVNLDPFKVIFDLLRYVGLTHVGAIAMLVDMHPWTLKVPELVPFFKRYARDLRKLHQIDEDLRPYHRVLVDQSDFLCITSEIRPLIAVAGSFVEEIESTFSGYVYSKDKYSGLIAKVRSMDPKATGNPDMSRLAELFQAPDMDPKPLPDITAASVPTQAPL